MPVIQQRCNYFSEGGFLVSVSVVGQTVWSWSFAAGARTTVAQL